MVVGLLLFAAGAARAAGEERLARDLARVLVAGRAVVAQYQPVINDAKRGAKGFTPPVFSAAVAGELAKSGLHLGTLNPARPADRAVLALLEAMRTVVGEAQPVIDAPGVGYKGFTPAIFGLRAGQRFTAATGIAIKQTSDRVRNPSNAPDAFERAVLARFAAAGWEKGKGYAEAGGEGGRKVLRYLQPLYVAKPCLACHGDPKGALDVAGRAKEGYREGELRGAISVVVPVSG